MEGTIQSSDASGSRGTYQHDWLLQRVEDLIRDPQNRGLMVHVNSPGGGVYQTDELYLKLKEYKEKTKRPLDFFRRDRCCIRRILHRSLWRLHLR